MTKHHITISSKKKKSLKNFINFLEQSFNLQKFQLLSHCKINKKKIKKFTVLKSPHVNKSAQEQFEYKIYSITINISSYKIKKYLLFIKKIRNQLFTEINIKTTGSYSIKNKQNITNKQNIYINKFTIKLSKLNCINQKIKFKKHQKTYKKINKNLLKRTTHYLNLLNYCGN